MSIKGLGAIWKILEEILGEGDMLACWGHPYMFVSKKYFHCNVESVCDKIKTKMDLFQNC